SDRSSGGSPHGSPAMDGKHAKLLRNCHASLGRIDLGVQEILVRLPPGAGAVSDLTVAQVAGMYVEYNRLRAEAAQIGWSHYRSLAHRMKLVAEALGIRRKLVKIGRAELQEAVLAFAKRPTRRPSPHHRTTPTTPIAAITARGRIATMKGFL